MKVLVTGGSGYVAGWILLKLLNKGYDVVTTVRSDEKGKQVKSMLERNDVDTTKFSYAIADLKDAHAWPPLMKRIDYVLHVASPFGSVAQDDPTIVETAKQGTLNVLSAAKDAGVKKIVLTSSLAAATPEKKNPNRQLDESYWTDINSKEINEYRKSKLVAEQSAWELLKDSNTILTTVLPGAIFGPLLDRSHTGSVQIIQRLLQGTPSANVNFEVVDVRDLADLHILAMEESKADGERYFGQHQNMTMNQMAHVLHHELGAKADKVKLWTIPNVVINIGGRFNSDIATLIPMMNRKFLHSNAKAVSLGWKPRPAKETIIDTAKSLIDWDLV